MNLNDARLLRMSRSLQTPFGLLVFWVLVFQLLVVVYWPAIPGPFVYDDIGGILANEDIYHLTEIGRFFSDHDSSLKFDRRPVSGISMALNQHFFGMAPGPFRVTNLLIHWINGMLLAALLSVVGRRFNFSYSNVFAAGMALIWLFHPLSSSTVSFIYQRSEMLMTTFVLLSLLCFMAAEKKNRMLFLGLSGLLAVLAVLSKEIGLTIIVVLVLTDWLVLTGTLKGALAKNWPYYGCLLVVFGMLIVWINSGVRMTELSMGGELATSWGYFKYQAGVLMSYLQKVIWPHPLIFVSQPGEVPSISEWLPKFLLLTFGLVACFLSGLKRRWVWLGLGSVLALLGPTSSFIPIPLEPEAEFRMYLPLAIILALVLGGVGKVLVHRNPRMVVWGGGLLLIGGSVTSWHRNHDFSSVPRLWGSVLEHQPDNVKAWGHLVGHHRSRGEFMEASLCADNLLRIAARTGKDTHQVMGRLAAARVALDLGNAEEALMEFRTLKGQAVGLGDLNEEIALALLRLDRREEWIKHFDESGWKPDDFRGSVRALWAERWIREGQFQKADRIISDLEEIYQQAYPVRFLRELFEESRKSVDQENRHESSHQRDP